MITKIKERYDCTDEMPKDKQEFIKRCARIEGNVRFLREDWKCDKHGDFYVLGLEGKPFPVAECSDCKREEQIIRDSEEALAQSFLPNSGLFKTQWGLRLEQFSGEKATLAKEFLKNKQQLFLIVNDATQADSDLACAMVSEVCRGGRQGQIVKMLQLTYRIQATWKGGKKTTEDLLNEMIAYPFLVLDGIENTTEDWLYKFMTGLLTARATLKRKTVLLSENNARSSMGEKALVKSNGENTVQLASYQKLFYSPTLAEMEREGVDDNDGIPL